MLDLPATLKGFRASELDIYLGYYIIVNKSGREICRVYRWVDGETEEHYRERAELLVRMLNY